MDATLRRLIATLAVLVVGFAAFTVGYTVGRGGIDLFGDQGEGVGAITDAYNKIRSQSVNPPSEEELARAAIKAMVEAVRENGDPYATFYGPQGLQAFQELTSGQFSGVGIRLETRDGRFEVQSVLPSSPAQRAGMKAGDVITEVNGKPIEELTEGEAANIIRGPANTKVSVVVRRDEVELEFKMTRARIVIPNASARLIDNEVGYVRLFSFANGAADDIRDKVDHLRAKGADGIVLDLRDNPGGLFDEAVDVASLFIESGTIVTYKARDQEGVDYKANGDAYEDLPLVVLVNGGSASASEVVAGALQDLDRAELVGETTYGKGAVQHVFPMLDASALKFTTAIYLTPDGHDLSGSGLRPDVTVTGRRAQQERATAMVRGLVVAASGEQG
jgi:carboxyl-terminal processing protease